MTAPIELPAATLERILSELQLAASTTQRARLLQLLELLQRWNDTYNLTAVRDPAAMLVQHVADCLAVIRPLQERASPSRLLDVGSGAGFPGAVIAIMLPDVRVTCLDSVGKKSAFVQQVSGALGLTNLRSVHTRIEDFGEPPFDVVTSRAFTDLKRFTDLTSHSLAPKGDWMAMKGKIPADEIAQLATSALAIDVEQLIVPGLNADRCLVWLRRT